MKAVCLLSGGIDSPVAAKLMINKGAEVVFLHALIKDNKKKIEKLVNKIQPCSKVYYINHKLFLKKAVKVCDKKYTCVLCKRELYRQAELLCKEVGADFIITGESIGQVASQTLNNIKVLDSAVKTPIIRPLIGLSKQEIVNLAKDFETFNLSIQDSGVCEFVPSSPSTNAKIETILIEEKLLKRN